MFQLSAHRLRAGLLGCCLLLAGPAVSAADATDVDALRAALADARVEQIDALAPRSFDLAERAADTAGRDLERSRPADRIAARLSEGEAALQEASRIAAAARQLFSGLIDTRSDAMVAQAPELAPEAWSRAAGRFEQAMREHEGGNLQNAQRRAAEAEVLLREAEMLGIKAGLLDEARQLIEQADQQRVARFAPRTLQDARRLLMEADQEIQRNRYDVELPRRLAAQAAYEARHASYLARQIEQTLAQEKQGGGVEALVLDWEAPLRQIAADMELDIRFDQGHHPPMQELGEHARQQAQEIRRLKQELIDRDDQISALNAESQRLTSRLGGESQERIALQRQVDAQQRLRADIAAVEAMFSPQQARVYRQGNDLVLSLLGLSFSSGRSALSPAGTALMQKVREALGRFPQAAILVEGHTDAQGSDSANLILSQDRADVVRQYLVSEFGLDAERITSIGYGEARPVATNETAAGRARNRRIDLVIHLE